jgi:hypothetical protein
VLHKLRPLLPPDMPTELAALISSCWDDNPSRRPSFKEVLLALLQLRTAYMVGQLQLLQRLALWPSFSGCGICPCCRQKLEYLPPMTACLMPARLSLQLGGDSCEEDNMLSSSLTDTRDEHTR